MPGSWATTSPGPVLPALLIPAVLTGGAAAAIQLVPPGLGLVPCLAGFAFLLDRTLVLEMRLLAQTAGATDADRARVLLAAVAAAFVAFTGVAALVPGGLAEPGSAAAGADAVLTEGWVIALAAADALVAALLGYRVATFRYGTAKDAARSALTYAIVVAVAAGAIRAIGGPAPRRACRAHPRVLPVGRAPRDRPGPAPGAEVPVGDDPAHRARGGGRRVERSPPVP